MIRTCFMFHEPVMLVEVLKFLGLAPGEVVVDATLGGGGHALEFFRAVTPGGRLIGIDRDSEAIACASERLSKPGGLVSLIKGKMSGIKEILNGIGIEYADAIFADLGVSSHQFDASYRGFGFREDAPLDMRMDREDGMSVAELIEKLSEEELKNVISEFGEERYAGRIARSLTEKCGSIKTTGQMAEAIYQAVPPRARHGHIHPATRTFQALRILVNDEIGELEKFLADAPKMLGEGGRLAIISYHSLEDRRVKQAFRKFTAGGKFFLPVKKALRPTEDEIKLNPRARSAKLRILKRGKRE